MWCCTHLTPTPRLSAARSLGEEKTHRPDFFFVSGHHFSKCCILIGFLSNLITHRETVNSNSTLEKSFKITPLLANNKEKRGLSVDGRLKDEDTHLASTTL